MATPLGKIYSLPLWLDLRSDRFPCFFRKSEYQICLKSQLRPWSQSLITCSAFNLTRSKSKIWLFRHKNFCKSCQRLNAACQCSGRVINVACRRDSHANNPVCTLLARVDLVPQSFLEFSSLKLSDLVLQALIQLANSVYLLYCLFDHWKIALVVFSHFIYKKQKSVFLFNRISCCFQSVTWFS